MSLESADPILAAHEQFLEGCRSGSVDDIMQLLSEDCVWMPTNETSLYGRDEVREWFDEYYRDFRITALNQTERDVTMMGSDWAAERWAYTVAIVPVKGGDRIRDDGRFLFLWNRNSQGQWKIAQFIFNSIRPIGSGTSRFMVRMMDRRRQESED